jgi:hypothetical protein
MFFYRLHRQLLRPEMGQEHSRTSPPLTVEAPSQLSTVFGATQWQIGEFIFSENPKPGDRPYALSLFVGYLEDARNVIQQNASDHQIFHFLSTQASYQQYAQMIRRLYAEWEPQKSNLPVDLQCVFLSCYHTEEEFKELCSRGEAGLDRIDSLKTFYRCFKNLPEENRISAVNSLPLTLLERIPDPDTLHTLLSDLTVENIPKLGSQIKLRADSLHADGRKNLLLQIFGSNLLRLLMGINTDESQRFIEFFNAFEGMLHEFFGLALYADIIPLLWERHFANPQSTEILKIIRELSPRIKRFIDTNVYIKLPPYDMSLKLTAEGAGEFEASQFISRRAHLTLFGTELPANLTALDRSGQKRLMLSQMLKVMVSPVICVKLLGSFEQQLQSEWKKEFPDIPYDQINGPCELRHLESLVWKVPLQKSEFKKNDFLQRQVLSFMQARGLGKRGYQFISSEPPAVFSHVVGQGFFFTERSSHAYFLFHGKMTHMLGMILLIRAYEEKYLSFTDKIPLRELVEALTLPEFKHPRTGDPSWAHIFDTALPDKYVFTDPHVFHAMIMSACSESLPCLSAVVTHSFGKGIYKLRDFFNWMGLCDWSIDQIWEHYISPRIMHQMTEFTTNGSKMTNESRSFLAYKYQLNEVTQPMLFLHKLFRGRGEGATQASSSNNNQRGRVIV